MNPMSTFDPDRPCRVHDAMNDWMIAWQTGWADKWRQFAKLGSEGLAYFDGRMLDGWEPLNSANGGQSSLDQGIIAITFSYGFAY
jgi:hypothetical protein